MIDFIYGMDGVLFVLLIGCCIVAASLTVFCGFILFDTIRSIKREERKIPWKDIKACYCKMDAELTYSVMEEQKKWKPNFVRRIY